jgi:hypothetical protein
MRPASETFATGNRYQSVTSQCGTSLLEGFWSGGAVAAVSRVIGPMQPTCRPTDVGWWAIPATLDTPDGNLPFPRPSKMAVVLNTDTSPLHRWLRYEIQGLVPHHSPPFPICPEIMPLTRSRGHADRGTMPTARGDWGGQSQSPWPPAPRYNTAGVAVLPFRRAGSRVPCSVVNRCTVLPNPF